MKTHVNVAAAAVAAAGLLAAAGCSSSSSSSPSGSGGSVVKLSVLTGFTGPDGPSYQALVSQFNASHPNIKVTMDIQPWDAIGQKLPSEWATGQGRGGDFHVRLHGSSMSVDASMDLVYDVAGTGRYTRGV